MFDRPHHNRVARILEAFDGGLLAQSCCYFGGGTAIALRYGEFRESVDIDLLVSDRGGYGSLRERVHQARSINALTIHPLTELRVPITDQYGVRTIVEVDSEPIKVEIVAEGRIELEHPAAHDEICGITTLTELDMATTKLLANSDRWTDTAVHARDLIDLAMMEPSADLFHLAVSKAETAYRSSVITDLTRAIGYLRDNPRRLDEYMTALSMHTTAPAVLWQRISRLQRI
ncbi:nucleotidyl transferase AbiEii/AbiGii toxin family protein [Gordonia hydrophobica]|uniref:Nucleotidyl transferase AbiEii/AbiGii toxin family protein n=1 Tax=Gordonia hydrophobica TaxID=40516 RepID=A0ABZ2TWP7_9ACTN|nr:nucleotidyl transferase AbiEii/AbiGii toxin family protein [Gordonia hydrophobica]MBM7369292.1 hypothetical protein [Gordonia hydrophobica]